jgi:hypothetical protein
MHTFESELEFELGLAANALQEFEQPEYMAGGVGFCTVPNCGGVLAKRGRRWVCPVCSARYDANPSATASGTVGPEQGHTTNARGSTWDKHTRRRPGGSEKKDRRKQRELDVELELASAALELEGIPADVLVPEGETGLGAATALTQLVAQLSQSAGLATPQDQQLALALALKQVDASGAHLRRAVNKPDVSYVSAGPGGALQRVNIEIESDKPFQHLKQVRRDAAATNVFVKVHPWTGQIEKAWILQPGAKGQPTEITPTQMQNLQATLPKPVRDPSLTIDPKTGQQKRLPQPKPPQPTRTRSAARPTQRPSAAARGSGGRRQRELESEFEFELEHAANEMESEGAEQMSDYRLSPAQRRAAQVRNARRARASQVIQNAQTRLGRLQQLQEQARKDAAAGRTGAWARMDAIHRDMDRYNYVLRQYQQL